MKGSVRFEGVCTEYPDDKYVHLPGITAYVTCPHCGHDQTHDLGEWFGEYAPMDAPYEWSGVCEECEEDFVFLVQANTEVRITCEVVEED